MRTLALIAALLLLALQAQAQTLQETADQVPAQDQPETKDQGELWAEDEDQDQAEDSDQDVTISFTGEERLTRDAGFQVKNNCKCRRRRFCKFREHHNGSCAILGHKYRLCCK